jgi:hypothetical protein
MTPGIATVRQMVGIVAAQYALFKPDLNAFRTQGNSIGYLMKPASRWVLLLLRELLLEPTELAGLGQYSQAIENGLRLSSASTR